MKDYRDDCRSQNLSSTSLSSDCEVALRNPLSPPPFSSSHVREKRLLGPEPHAIRHLRGVSVLGIGHGRGNSSQITVVAAVFVILLTLLLVILRRTLGRTEDGTTRVIDIGQTRQNSVSMGESGPASWVATSIARKALSAFQGQNIASGLRHRRLTRGTRLDDDTEGWQTVEMVYRRRLAKGNSEQSAHSHKLDEYDSAALYDLLEDSVVVDFGLEDGLRQNGSSDNLSTIVSPSIEETYPTADVRFYCPLCNDVSSLDTGYEFREHMRHKHPSQHPVWICEEGQRGGTILSPCEACKSKRRYGAKYNAAAHLERAHFNVRRRRRGDRLTIPARTSSTTDDEKLSYGVLEPWMRQVVAVEVNGKLVLKPTNWDEIRPEDVTSSDGVADDAPNEADPVFLDLDHEHLTEMVPQFVACGQVQQEFELPRSGDSMSYMTPRSWSESRKATGEYQPAEILHRQRPIPRIDATRKDITAPASSPERFLGDTVLREPPFYPDRPRRAPRVAGPTQERLNLTEDLVLSAGDRYTRNDDGRSAHRDAARVEADANQPIKARPDTLSDKTTQVESAGQSVLESSVQVGRPNSKDSWLKRQLQRTRRLRVR